LEREISTTAKGQRVIGMTDDEIRGEMIVCLWNAHQTFKPGQGLTIEQYWWSIWKKRKTDLLRYTLAGMRDPHLKVLVDNGSFFSIEDESDKTLSVVHQDVLVPSCPTLDPLHQHVWAMLAYGATRQDVMLATGISKKGYYTIISAWRSESTQHLLKEGTSA